MSQPPPGTWDAWQHQYQDAQHEGVRRSLEAEFRESMRREEEAAGHPRFPGLRVVGKVSLFFGVLGLGTVFLLMVPLALFMGMPSVVETALSFSILPGILSAIGLLLLAPSLLAGGRRG